MFFLAGWNFVDVDAIGSPFLWPPPLMMVVAQMTTESKLRRSKNPTKTLESLAMKARLTRSAPGKEG